MSYKKMDLCDMMPGPKTDAEWRWQKNMVRRIKLNVRRHRAFGLQIRDLVRPHKSRWHETDVVATLAELAGVDWLYDPNTGDVRFFEFN